MKKRKTKPGPGPITLSHAEQAAIINALERMEANLRSIRAELREYRSCLQSIADGNRNTLDRRLARSTLTFVDEMKRSRQTVIGDKAGI